MKKDKETKNRGFVGIFEKAGKELGKVSEKEKKYERDFIHKRIETQEDSEIKKLE